MRPLLRRKFRRRTRKKEKSHTHPLCQRCVYLDDLVSWFRIENQRLMRQWRGSEESRLDQQRDYKANKGALYRALAEVTRAETLYQAIEIAHGQLRKHR